VWIHPHAAATTAASDADDDPAAGDANTDHDSGDSSTRAHANADSAGNLDSANDFNSASAKRREDAGVGGQSVRGGNAASESDSEPHQGQGEVSDAKPGAKIKPFRIS
jgi:hypothetical protein